MDANMDISVDYSVLDTGVSAIKDIKGRCSDLISALSSVDVSILESGYLLTQAVSTVEEIMSGSVEEVLRNIIDVETLFYMFQNQDFFTRLQEELKNGTFNDENNNRDIEKIMEYMIANSDGRYQDLLKDEDFRRLFIMQNLLSSYGITSMRDLNAFRDVCFLKVRTYEEEADKLKYSPARLTQEFMNIINARYRGSYGKGLSNVADTTIMAYSYVDSNGNQILTDSLDNIPKDKKREAKGLSYTDLCGDSEEYRKLMDISSGIKSIAMLGPGSDFSKFREELSTQIKEDDARLKEIDEILNDQDNSDDVIGYRTQLTLIDGIRQDVISRTDHLTKLYGYMLNDDFKEMSNENYKEISSAVNDLKEKASSLAIWGRGEDTSIYAPIDEGDETNLVLYSLISDNEEFIVDPFGGICYSEGGKLYTLLNSDDTLSNYSRWAPVMTEDEKKCFYYIWNKEGSDKSYEYLQDISDVLDNRWVEQQSLADSSFALEHKCAASVFSIVSNPVNGLSTLLYSFQQWANDKEMRKTQLYSPGDVMRGAISQELTEESAVKGFFYNVGMSIGDNLYSMLLSGGNSTLSGMFLGFGAYDDNLNDALSRGLSDEDAIKYAGAMATVECITESVSIENLLNIKPVKAIVDIPVDDVVELSGGKKIVKDVLQPLDTINNAADDIFSETVLKNLDKFTNPTARKCAYYASNIVYQGLKQGLGEGNEEVASAILGRWADDWISDENSSYLKEIEGYLDLGYNEVDAIAMANKNFKSEMGQSFLAGFCSGDIMGSGKVTIGLVSADVSADNILKEFYDSTYHADLKEARANMREGNYPALFSQILNDTSVPIEQRIADANKIVDAMEERGLITKEGHDQLARFVNDYDSAKVLTDHLIDGGAADFKESLESIQEDSSLETDLELSSDTDLRQDDRNVHEVVSESNERDSIHFETETDVNTSDNSKTDPLLKSETQNDSVDTNDKINGDSLVEKRKNSTDSIDQRQNMDETIQKDTSLEIDFQQANDLHKVDAVIKNDINMDSQTADSVISPKVQEQGIDTAIKAAQVAFDVSSVEDIENSPIGVEKVDTRVQSVQNKELTLSEVAAKQAFDPSQHRESIVSNHQKINNDLMQSTEDKTSFGARNADSMALADDIGIAKISSTAAAIAMLGVDTDNQNSSNLYSNERITIDGESDSSYDGDTFSSKDSALAQKKLSDGEYELEDGESLSDYHIGIQFFAEPKTNSGTIQDGIDLNTDNVTVTDNFESDTGINISKPRNIIVDGKNYVVNFFSGIKDFIVARSIEFKNLKGKTITNEINSLSESVYKTLSSEKMHMLHYTFSESTPDFVKTDASFIMNCLDNSYLPFLLAHADLSVLSETQLESVIIRCVYSDIYLNSGSPDILKQNPSYIMRSIENYVRKSRYDNYSNLRKCGKDSSFIEIVENVNFDILSEEQCKEVLKVLEQQNYRVTEDTPIELLKNRYFFDYAVRFSSNNNSLLAILCEIDSEHLIDRLKYTDYVISGSSPDAIKSSPDIIMRSIENCRFGNSRLNDIAKFADFSRLTSTELLSVVDEFGHSEYNFSNLPSTLANLIVSNSETFSGYHLMTAMQFCDQDVLRNCLVEGKLSVDLMSYGDVLYSKNGVMIADYLMENSNDFNAVYFAANCCSDEAFTKHVAKLVILCNRVGTHFISNSQAKSDIYNNVLSNKREIANYLVQHPYLDSHALEQVMGYCDSKLLTDNILEQIIPSFSNLYQFKGEHREIVANYILQHPELNNLLLTQAMNYWDSKLLTDSALDKCIPLLNGSYDFIAKNGEIVANYIVQHPELNNLLLTEAVYYCDTKLLTDSALEQCIPLLNKFYGFSRENGKIIANYLVQHPDLNSQILVGAINNCFLEVFNDNKDKLLIYFESTSVLETPLRIVEYVFNKYSDLKLSEGEIRIFQEYMGNDFDLAFLEKNLVPCYEIFDRLKHTNSKSLASFGKVLMPQLLATDHPLKSLVAIETIFVRNNIPLFGKVYSAFQILYPNLEKFYFADDGIMSPELKDSSLGEIRNFTGKKMTANDVRFNIIYNDLMRIAVRSNNINLRQYLNNISEGNDLFVKLSHEEISYDDLSTHDKKVLDVFSSHLEVLYLNTVAGKNSNIDFSQYSLIDKIDFLKDKFKPTSRYDLKDRIVRTFGYSAGYKSFGDLIAAMDNAILETDMRGRKYAEVLSGDNCFTFEVGDFVRGIGDYKVLGSSLDSGNVSKEYLSVFTQTSNSDLTPLDIDFSYITSGGSVSEVMKNTVTGSNYGNVCLIIKNDNPNLNITRDKNNTLTNARYDASKIEMFRTRGEEHWGARTGIALTDVDYILYQGSNSVEVNSIKFDIARHGYYMPVINADGKLIFTVDEYEGIRKQMSGLSYYGISDYEFSDNLVAPNVSELVSKFDYNEKITTEKRNKIDTVLQEVFSKYDLTLSHEITEDLTPGTVELIDTGSTGRGTNKIGDGDFDFLLRVDQQLFSDSSRYEQFKQDILDRLKKSSIDEVVITGNGDYRLKGVSIDADTTVDIDISFAIRTDGIDYSSDACLKDRLKTIREQDPDKYKYVVSNVLLAKQVLKEGGVYKPYRSDSSQGGLGGIGIENWVLEHGGSFVDAARSFVDAADGKSWNEFNNTYFVWDFGQNYFAERNSRYLYDNFVYNNMSEAGYNKMVAVLKNYLATIEGQDIRYDSISNNKNNRDFHIGTQFFAQPKVETNSSSNTIDVSHSNIGVDTI